MSPAKPPSAGLGGFVRSRTGITLLVFLAVAGVLLVLEHRAHIPGDYWLLGGLLALCGGMHLFMHGGHGGGGGGGHRGDER